MSHTRRHAFKILGLCLAISSISGFSGTAAAHDDNDDDDGSRSGRVFTSTNAVAGNELLIYATAPSGALAPQARLAMQGQGTGGGLGNQGAVTLKRNPPR